jgi:ribose transport system substrate-binding protein
MTRHALAVIVVAAAAVICLASGCGNESGKTASTFTIAVVPMGTTHEFWKAIHAGALTAARENGVEIIWKGPLKEDDREEQIQLVETLISRHVDALVLSPLDNRALVRTVRDAKNAGIPTIIFNSALEGDFHESFVSTDNYRGGALAAEHIGRLLNGTGNLVQVLYQEGVEGTTKREQGFRNTIRERFPGITILSDNQYTGVTTESAYRTCENLLNRFRDIDALFAPNESTTFGCLRALEDRGLAGTIVFVGFDSSDKLIEAMEKGYINGLVVQNPFRMGYAGVGNAVKCLRGESFERHVDTGVTLATPGNMHESEIVTLLKPDLSILAE